MWLDIVQGIVISDLLINFFFHILQLRKYCCQQDALLLLDRRFGSFESKLGGVELQSRLFNQSLSAGRLKIVPSDSEKEEETD
jgi:hypothetical protein